MPKNVYIWGVTAKTVLVLNLFKVNTLGGREIISGAVDFSSHKIDRYLPGTNIKVFNEENFDPKEKVTVIIGARNFSKELIQKIKVRCKKPNILVPPF